MCPLTLFGGHIETKSEENKRRVEEAITEGNKKREDRMADYPCN